MVKLNDGKRITLGLAKRHRTDTAKSVCTPRGSRWVVTCMASITSWWSSSQVTSEKVLEVNAVNMSTVTYRVNAAGNSGWKRIKSLKTFQTLEQPAGRYVYGRILSNSYSSEESETSNKIQSTNIFIPGNLLSLALIPVIFFPSLYSFCPIFLVRVE